MSRTVLVPIVLPLDPVQPLEAATKQYVDKKTTDQYPYRWSVTTTMADPGTGFMRANNANPLVATEIAMSTTDDLGALRYNVARLGVSDKVLVYQDLDRWVEYHVDAPPTNSANIWIQATVAVTDQSVTTFAPTNNTPVQVIIVQSGAAPSGEVVNEVWIGTDEPTDPNIELWYDSDAPAPATATVVDLYRVPGSYTWTKPPGAKRVRMDAVAPGGGGGSGRRGAAGTIRCGGGGGTGGNIAWAEYAASDLPASLTILISAGGAGGAAVTTDDTNGNPGVGGGNCHVYQASGNMYYLQVRGAVFGAGGSATAGAGGSASPGMLVGAAGGSASTTGGVGAGGNSGPAGSGGAGGGITSANVASAGGNAGRTTVRVDTNYTLGGAIDTSGVTPSVPAPTSSLFCGHGGPGGGSSLGALAGAGADGQASGGGGGGGGASVNGNPSGAGGKGGDGAIMMTSYF